MANKTTGAKRRRTSPDLSNHLLQSTRRRLSSVNLTYPDWTNLPNDMFESILNLLPFMDVLRFRAVSSSYRSVAKTHISSSPLYRPLLQPPWLILPSNDDHFERDGDADEEGFDHSHGRCFFSLAEKKYYKLNNVPRALRQSRCVGSSQGWLLFLDEKRAPYIFNPFLEVGIRLFFLSTSPFITKAVLWNDPIRSDNNYAIVAIYDSGLDSKLAYATCGDSNWTGLNGSHEAYHDIICCKDYVYALADMGSVEVWDFGCSVPTKVLDLEASFYGESLEFEQSLRGLYSSQFYLVESLGEFLLLVRYIGDFVRYDGEVVGEADLEDDLIYPYMTKFFHVYKLDLKKDKWEKVESLGDRILFLGGNQSMSLSARDFPDYEGNSIYFTDDCWERMDEHYQYGGHDMGVFNLEDGFIKQISGIDYLQRFQPPPFWVVPSSVQPRH